MSASFSMNSMLVVAETGPSVYVDILLHLQIYRPK